MCDYYVEILLICNFHLSRARNYATTVISKLNNFAEVLAVRVHVDVYMATAVLRSLTHETLCDTGQRTADTLKFTNHHLPITKSLHFKPSILVFFAASPQKNIDGKNKDLLRPVTRFARARARQAAARSRQGGRARCLAEARILLPEIFV